MYSKLQREGRVLPLPFVFQMSGYLNIVPKHYSPVETLQGFIDLVDGVSEWGQWRERTRGQPWRVKLGDFFYKSGAGKRAQRVLDMMAKYPDDVVRFHAGMDQQVPECYWQEQERLLGRFAGTLTRDELTPVHCLSQRVARQEDLHSTSRTLASVCDHHRQLRPTEADTAAVAREQGQALLEGPG